MNEPFWMIFREYGGSPTVKHPTESQARAEAMRLARINPGEKFYVLQSIAECCKVDVKWTDHRQIPF